MARRSAAPVRKAVTNVVVETIDELGRRSRPDHVVTEEPLEIRVRGPREEASSVAVTMRTPGNDFELAVGWCVAEGLLTSSEEISRVEYCLGPDGEQEYNVVTIATRASIADRVVPRNYAANASCGLCGKAVLDDIVAACHRIESDVVVDQSVLLNLTNQLLGAQRVFDATGGLHAAARFSIDGELLELREDIGRHNALDKLIGHAVLEGVDTLSREIVVVSGRSSYEIVQKAAMAGVPIVVAVSAPSGLAVQAAREVGQTLVGFARDGRANVYTHGFRVGGVSS